MLSCCMLCRLSFCSSVIYLLIKIIDSGNKRCNIPSNVLSLMRYGQQLGTNPDRRAKGNGRSDSAWMWVGWVRESPKTCSSTNFLQVPVERMVIHIYIYIYIYIGPLTQAIFAAIFFLLMHAVKWIDLYECIRPSVQSYIDQYFCDSIALRQNKSPV